MTYIEENQAYSDFDDYIDEITPTVTILGMTYCPSTVLKECDPIAYDCEFDNWLDANDLTINEDEADND